MVNNVLSNRTSRLSPKLIVTLGLVVLIIIAYTYIFKSTPTRVEITHDIVLEKMETLGKMELTKYTIKDVLEKNVIKGFWVDWFDEKVLFIAVGEAAGCIDFTKLKKEDITIGDELVTIQLPAPEICYTKLNHEKSKVYHISGVYTETRTRQHIEEVYKIAEAKIAENALAMGILDKTKENAQLVLKPLFENLTRKKVKLEFKK